LKVTISETQRFHEKFAALRIQVNFGPPEMRSFAHRRDKAYALGSNHSMERTFTPVSRADIEQFWSIVAAGVSQPNNGTFGLSSIG
jgi:hypothetical protein